MLGNVLGKEKFMLRGDKLSRKPVHQAPQTSSRGDHRVHGGHRGCGCLGDGGGPRRCSREWETNGGGIHVQGPATTQQHI